VGSSVVTAAADPGTTVDSSVVDAAAPGATVGSPDADVVEARFRHVAVRNPFISTRRP
jgi:hypothetical protein